MQSIQAASPSPACEQFPQSPVNDPRYVAAVEGMTNWERSQWAGAGHPGATDQDADRVAEFLANLPARFERGRYTLTSVSPKVTLTDMLRGRTGITIVEFGENTALVEATARMIERLVDRYSYALTAKPHGREPGSDTRVYVGARKELYGKTALILPGEPGRVQAQFDDTGTGLGHGWCEFDETEFEPRT